MLFSSIIANKTHNGLDNHWKLIIDEYGNALLHCESIKQKIRLSKNVNTDFRNIYTYTENGLFECKGYSLPSKTFISNNYTNMNLHLLNYRASDLNGLELYRNDNIAYITISNKDYRLLGYDNYDNNIVQTYNCDKQYQGCAVLFNDYDVLLMTLIVQEISTTKVYEISIYVNSPKQLSVYRIEINLKTLRQKLYHIYNNDKQVNTHFCISVDKGKFLTKTYLTTKEHEKFLSNILKKSGLTNFDIITVDENQLCRKDLPVKQILDSRVRALTTYGVNVSREFCKAHRILYLFEYDDTLNKLICKKSI